MIYNYLYSKKINTNKENKIDLKKVKYPTLYEENYSKITKEKKKQNFRLKSGKYVLGDNNILYLKKLNKNNEITLLKVPFLGEIRSLLLQYHDNNDHISYKRVNTELINAKIFWKITRNNIITYISECASSIRSKVGKDVKSKPLQIITKGPDLYILDGWKLPKDIVKKSGFSWVIDIIDHFSKCMMS